MTPNRVHIYCRVSSAGQEDNFSLETQDAACRRWAQERDLPVASVTHEVWSGTDRHRPKLTALLDSLMPGDIVLAYALDRFSRSQIDVAILIDRIESAGASLELVTEDFEKSATGTFLRGAKAFAAELEREKIIERTQRGRRARVASGKPLVGFKCPYGYRWADEEKSHYDLDPETAPVVRMLFDWALSGISLRGSVAKLADLGIPSPSGRPRWVLPAVRDILARSIYTGTATTYALLSARTTQGGYTRRRAGADEVVLLPNIAPAIVTPEEQAAVMARFTSNKEQAARNNRDPESTLLRAGFLTCGHCGYGIRVVHRPASRPNSSAQYRCYPCDNRAPGCPRPTIAASLIDPIVWQHVADVLRDPEIVGREVARRRSDGSLDRDHAALTKRIDAIADKQTRMARRVGEIADDDVAAPLLAELKSLAAQKTDALQQRDALERRMTDRADEDARVASLAAWCSRVGVNLEAMSYDQKRLALEAFDVKVRIYKQGAIDADGNPLPRWDMSMRPGTGELVVNSSTCKAIHNAPLVTLHWTSNDVPEVAA
jgi:site-specific DNA recombinase